MTDSGDGHSQPEPDFPASLSTGAGHSGGHLRERMQDLSSSVGGGGGGYAAAWLMDETLDELNARIHDGAPTEGLLDRGRGYRDWLFGEFPEAAPRPGDAVLELGSGVGWIMEAMLERWPDTTVTGLDISPVMIARAQERLDDRRADFVLYDGLVVPIEDGTFPVVYSVAAMQHIEKHVAFLLFEELHRILRPGGHAVIHLLAVDHIPGASPGYHEECLNHVHDRPGHWHHYYAFDELLVLFAEVIGVSDLDLVYDPTTKSFLVHFGKGGATPFRRPGLASMRHSVVAGATPVAAPAPDPEAPVAGPQPGAGPQPAGGPQPGAGPQPAGGPQPAAAAPRPPSLRAVASEARRYVRHVRANR